MSGLPIPTHCTRIVRLRSYNYQHSLLGAGYHYATEALSTSYAKMEKESECKINTFFKKTKRQKKKSTSWHKILYNINIYNLFLQSVQIALHHHDRTILPGL